MIGLRNEKRRHCDRKSLFRPNPNLLDALVAQCHSCVEHKTGAVYKSCVYKSCVYKSRVCKSGVCAIFRRYDLSEETKSV